VTHSLVTPSASRIPALSATPLGFASGIAEVQEFTPTDPTEPSANLGGEGSEGATGKTFEN
jgi:hypothetical protein